MIKTRISKLPVFFPIAAGFHFLILGYSIRNYSEFPFPSMYWLPVGWLLAYLLAWLFVCNLSRWGAWSYLLLTAANAVLYFTLHTPTDIALYTPPLLLLHVFFSFFLLVYYKKFS